MNIDLSTIEGLLITASRVSNISKSYLIDGLKNQFMGDINVLKKKLYLKKHFKNDAPPKSLFYLFIITLYQV